MKVYLISLGCKKNFVDSENILANILGPNFKYTEKMNLADLILINTCAFIDQAKETSINQILEVIDEKKNNQKVVVLGCLSTRYLSELEELIPEVDLYVSIKDYPKLPQMINDLFGHELLSDEFDLEKRAYTTSLYSQFVKISEGCNRRCAYCAIPFIRGNFVSRKKEDILKEVADLVEKGCKEINLISQETSYYGYDFKEKYNLIDLLKEIDQIEGDYFVRLLYLYPMRVTEELIDYIKVSPHVIPYFDIPLQHSEDHILKRMNRGHTKEFSYNLLKRIRTEIPDATIRTTFIVGFPGETEEDFNNLLSFMKDIQFDRVGAFTYSKEEGTKAYSMDGQIDDETKNKRLEELYYVQDEIALNNSQKQLGKVFKTLILEYDPDEFCYIGRSYQFASDDIDGYIMVYSEDELEIGAFYDVKIVDANIDYLAGKVV